MKCSCLIFLSFAVLLIRGNAAEYYVSYESGENSNPGTKDAPFANIRKAVETARAGDCIFILPSNRMIEDSIKIRNRHGEKTQPIVIDGMMNTFTGSRALKETEWKEVSPGMFLRTKKTAAGMVNRYFLWIGGKQVRMGRRSKFGSASKLKKPEDLKEFEWTIVDRERYYLRLPAGKTPRDFSVREPVEISGVAVSGTSRHVIVRNLILRDYWNDGLNIHNTARGIVFENTAALFCGDDGASAHNDCETTIRNFVSIGNATGICHIGNAVTVHENVYISGIDSRDLFLLSRENRLCNVYVDGSAPGPLVIRGSGETPMTGSLENCLFWNHGGKNRIDLAPSLRYDKIGISGYSSRNHLPPGITVLKQAPEKEIEAAREKLFSLFGGKLEKELKR